MLPVVLRSHRRALFAASLIAAAIAGCSDGAPSSVPPGGACTADAECSGGSVCAYATCRPPCKTDEDCRGDDVCNDGHCEKPCVKDSECPGSQRCQEGDCLPPCRSDRDCLPGYACKDGRCFAKPGKKIGERCGKPGPSTECATGYCLQSRRICSAICTNTDWCPKAYACGLEKLDDDQNGTLDHAIAACVPRKGKKLAGQTCGEDAACASAHCYNGFCMEGCGSDSDCAKSQLCSPVKLILRGAIADYKGCLPKSGTSTFKLGTYDNGTIAGIDVPKHAASLALTSSIRSEDEIVTLLELKEPKGKSIFSTTSACAYYAELDRVQYSEGQCTALVPNTSSVSLQPGVYTFRPGSQATGESITVQATMKLGRQSKGVLDLNWYFLNLASSCVPAPTLNAGSADSHSWFAKLRRDLQTILDKAGIKLGKQTYQDVKKPALDVISFDANGLSTELHQLFKLSKGRRGYSLNVFLVRDLQANIGGTVLGIAGGIPGPPGIHGTLHSGVAVSMKGVCFEKNGYNAAHTLAHEIGHYLGLYHNLERPSTPGYDERQKKVVCPCPCGTNSVCQYGPNNTRWCRGMDPIPDTSSSSLNLMYYAAESTQVSKGNQLTKAQVRVMLDSPIVKR